MSGFTTPSGERFPIFGEGGGQELADELDVPLLGRVPLTMPLREQADAGVPLVVEDPDDPAAQAIRQVARGADRDGAGGAGELPVLPLVEVGAPATVRPARAACPPPPRSENRRACRCRWLSRRPQDPCGRSRPGHPCGLARPLDKRNHFERIVLTMSASGHTAGGEKQDRPSGEQGAHGAERRRRKSTNAAAKMERLRAEGIDPYPPVTLWGKRTRIADVLGAHDPSDARAGRAPRAALRRRRAADLAPRARQDVRSSTCATCRARSRSSCASTRSARRPTTAILGLDIGDIVRSTAAST